MFPKINYHSLNARQQEIYNFQAIAARLNEYGFNCIKLADDWNGADFIANHMQNDIFLKVQLKSRITINKKYIGKDLWIGFPYKNNWYMVKHDELLSKVSLANKWINSTSWMEKGAYSSPSIPSWLLNYIASHKL